MRPWDPAYDASGPPPSENHRPPPFVSECKMTSRLWNEVHDERLARQYGFSRPLIKEKGGESHVAYPPRYSFLKWWAVQESNL